MSAARALIAALERLAGGSILTEAEAHAAVGEIMAGERPRRDDRRVPDGAARQGRDRRRAGRRGRGGPRADGAAGTTATRRLAGPARHLRHRRRRGEHGQHLDGDGDRGRRLRRAGRQARQPLGLGQLGQRGGPDRAGRRHRGRRRPDSAAAWPSWGSPSSSPRRFHPALRVRGRRCAASCRSARSSTWSARWRTPPGRSSSSSASRASGRPSCGRGARPARDTTRAAVVTRRGRARRGDARRPDRGPLGRVGRDLDPTGGPPTTSACPASRPPSSGSTGPSTSAALLRSFLEARTGPSAGRSWRTPRPRCSSRAGSVRCARGSTLAAEAVDSGRAAGLLERWAALSSGRWGLIVRRSRGRGAARKAPRAGHSSGVSLSDSAATASSRWCGFVAPMIGAVTPGLLKQPGQRDLGPGHCPRRGDLAHAVDDGAVGLLGPGVEGLAELVGAGPLGARPLVPGRGPAGRGPAGSRGSRRCPRRRRAGSSPAPPRGRAGCSGPASRRTASSRAGRPGTSALANCQANIDEAPRYRALPALTTSCSASSVSSIGVLVVPAVDLVEVDVIRAQPAEAGVDLGRGSPCATGPCRWGPCASGRRPWSRSRPRRAGRGRGSRGRGSPRWCRRSTSSRCRRS